MARQYLQFLTQFGGIDASDRQNASPNKPDLQNPGAPDFPFTQIAFHRIKRSMSFGGFESSVLDDGEAPKANKLARSSSPKLSISKSSNRKLFSKLLASTQSGSGPKLEKGRPQFIITPAKKQKTQRSPFPKHRRVRELRASKDEDVLYTPKGTESESFVWIKI
eukprot:TRINITY_DN96_c0_g2_i1.p1 TRINITY_DN96_c0_g2~~TRINITY_DN96_c0_g2_i1.p1  ORF type:complete len:164 (+),score=29.00 TRINITY_DN96_c0_g2_i1:118-609(+)